MRYVSIVTLTFLAFAFESAATPVLTHDKDVDNSILYERGMNDMQDGIVPFQKRVLITTPSPITFSSIGRKSKMNKVVRSSSSSTTTNTNTNTNTIRTDGIGSGVVTRNQNLAVGNLRGQPITTNRRITRTQNSSSSSTTTTRKTSSSSATTTTTRNGRVPIQSTTTLNQPINIGINTQVL